MPIIRLYSVKSAQLPFCALCAAVAAGLAANAQAQDTEALEEVEVIGITPTHGVGLPKDKIPVNVQSATAEDLDRQHNLDLSDYLNRNLGSVTINAAQNNPLQPDVQYRGFTASPLLGLPQGLAVYVNGVRVNEAFGDTINWDLLPESIISSINLIGGANPLFGQNTLGGALSIRTKNGFTDPGVAGEAYGGSFGRVVTDLEAGGNNGTLGYFVNLRYFDEDGWRDQSPSDALNLYGTVGWHRDATTLDLQYFRGDTELTGNGALPVELLALDRDAIFTAPDITENDLHMVNLEGTHWLNELIQLSGNAYYRTNDTDSFNGDATPFEECDDGVNQGLIEEDAFTDLDGSGECDAAGEFDPADLLVDQNGDLIDDDFDAINNISVRDQRSYGGTAQTTFLNDLFGRENQLIAGGAYNQGLVDFRSQVEVANLLADRSTDRPGIFVDGEETAIDARTRTWSAYFTDTFSISPELALTVSGRYNNTKVQISNVGDLVDEDGDGIDDITGEHTFTRFNPAVGLTYQVAPALGLYGGYSESARAPTPVELACADEDAPCTLPNAFLADPPLKQVVAKSFEGGARGRLLDNINWNLGGFHATNKDDIIFQATGGTTSNQGFFANVGDTRRRGIELGLHGTWQKLGWFANYGFVHATFEDPFIASSPRHPNATDLNGDGVAAEIRVEDGDRIPGIPQHSLKVGADYLVLPQLTVGADLTFNSGQYLRGDESNELDTTDSYAILNLRGEYRFGEHVSAFATINNLLDTEYETFGLLGDASEVDQFASFTDPRFLGPGAPIGGWVGVKISL
ncbi:MAG: TonB-dependent receptor [Chromatiales bacterium]